MLTETARLIQSQKQTGYCGNIAVTVYKMLTVDEWKR